MEKTISEEIFQKEMLLYDLFCNFTKLHRQTGKIGKTSVNFDTVNMWLNFQR